MRRGASEMSSGRKRRITSALELQLHREDRDLESEHNAEARHNEG